MTQRKPAVLFESLRSRPKQSISFLFRVNSVFSITASGSSTLRLMFWMINPDVFCSADCWKSASKLRLERPVGQGCSRCRAGCAFLLSASYGWIRFQRSNYCGRTQLPRFLANCLRVGKRVVNCELKATLRSKRGGKTRFLLAESLAAKE